MMHWWYGGMSAWGYAMMGLGMALFLVVVVLLVALLRALRGSRWRAADRLSGRQNPEDILAERFARGEISEQQYQEALRTLAGHAAPRG
ncbi:SHOCT domain-containing protein [Microlunatus sp. Gsoil 973]|uniref:SHOCT domain-containing protein n=1 Tax=Microlunatus sp. Gsoil 973 TaxID=2672569 RepID=UPI0012B48AFF|nr:SHOCT domain-containing protein [Microlunatus sp. Gsoil 973]QGN33936.1 SHOCT domain-containing protein [Microlunatus sp. Gsoil 973]